jgi:23S rRNA (uracil1939-C5)-methyltransferase
MGVRPTRGDVLELEVDDLAFGGQGVARADGFVVFTPDTAPGDRVRARLRKVRRRFGEGELQEVLRPGPERVAPPCPYVPRCGGCRLQHVAYEAALRAKVSQVAEHLSRIGGLPDVPVLDADPARERFGYRNKMEYSAAPGPRGLELGFHVRGRWDEVLGLDACLLATALGNRARDAIRGILREAGATAWHRGSGAVRHVVVREGVSTGEILVSLVTGPGGQGEEAAQALTSGLPGRLPELVGLLHLVNDGVAETTQGLPARLLWGRDWITETIAVDAPVTLRLSAPSFFQTNTSMTAHLYRRAAEAAGLDGTQVLYDLFAGVGSIGIALAGRAREVVAVEVVEEAVLDAAHNARVNGVANHRALAGDVGRLLRERGGELPRPDVVVVDPPRAGLAGRAVKRILELSPETIAYVSCHPATLADNARRFVDDGYRLEWVRPVDMFPQTPHIEAVARFVRA